MAAKRAQIFDEQAERLAVPSAALDGLIGYNLKRAYIHLNADFRRTLEADNLPPRVFSALSLVAENPGMKQTDVARLLGIERSGLVAIVDGLEARGLVERRPHPTDRRIQELQPTPEGQAVYRRALEAVAEHEVSFLSMLSDKEQETLLGLLRKIRQHLEDAG